MLDKFLVLLERFVVAHELIAANATKHAAVIGEAALLPVAEEKPAPAPRKTRTPKAKPAPEPEPEEEPEEEKPAPKARGKKQEKDVDVLRAEIKEMTTHIAGGDSDECANEFDDLLEEFKVRTVSKLADDDVAEFHALAKEIVEKYYEIED